MRATLLLLLVVTGCTDPSSTPAGPDASGPRADGAAPVCTGTIAGAYCGGDEVRDGDPATLYQCAAAGQPPTAALACASGCQIEAAGVPDRCATPASEDSYRLPWRAGVTMQLTQDCNDSCCADHVGTDEYAYDWANGGSFDVLADRGGTISHLKINSTTGCGASGCVNDANILVIDHGDGTQSTFLHLTGNSLAPGISCGAKVTRGELLARSGTTGWSTGIHLHFQVSKVHPGAPTCECGSAGKSCDASTVPWSSFWVTPTYPSLPIMFDEWPSAAQCGDRHITMPTSQNQ